MLRIRERRGGNHDFSKICRLIKPKNFVGETLCFRKVLASKKWIRGGRGREGLSRFSVKNFLFHSTEKLRKGTLLCLRKNLVSRIFMHKRGRGITVLRRIFISHSTETFRRGTLQCFRNFLVSKHVKYDKGGGYQDFPLKLFCLTVPKHFVEERFCAVFQENFR